MSHNDQVTIINAGLNELEMVAKVFNLYRIFYKQPSNLEESKKFIGERMKREQSIIFLAVENGNPLGFVQLYPSFSSVSMKKFWILNDLYVDSSARRKGVAKALLQKAKEFAAETGAKGLTLETAIDNYMNL